VFRENRYGIEAVNDTTYNGILEAIPECLEMIQSCRDAAAESDPENFGIDASANEVCDDAETTLHKYSNSSTQPCNLL
jgi:hypothetical protein